MADTKHTLRPLLALAILLTVCNPSSQSSHAASPSNGEQWRPAEPGNYVALRRDPALKQLALARDGIPASQGHLYEADHIVPLCLGGPNTLSNIQLQPWPEARRKDEVERRACHAVSAGEMTREQAVEIFTGHRGAW
jgi:hypothetical protein